MFASNENIELKGSFVDQENASSFGDQHVSVESKETMETPSTKDFLYSVPRRRSLSVSLGLGSLLQV
jgi:hypothetical protein